MSKGYWDIHNHILPGVDDGSSCFDETVELIKQEYEQGIRKIVFTPHYREGMFEVPPEVRYQVYSDTAAALRERFPDMKFYYGCELYLTDESIRFIQDKRNCLLGKSIVLAEFSYGVSFKAMVRLISELISCKFTVVLAHVERYRCLREDIARVGKLRSMGVWIQINSDSVSGKSGFKLKLFTHKLLKNNLADIMASDGHSCDMRPVRFTRAISIIERKYGMEMVDKLLIGNPNELLSGKGQAD